MIQDMENLASTFTDISKSDNIYVKVKEVDSNECKVWHQDNVRHFGAKGWNKETIRRQLHRSPRIDKEKGVFRLLLVLDIPQAGLHY